ncbi:hypothetical protein J4530_00260 [Neisseria subflava]|uniref:hypothetical protein n=1 Tax=Neisseria subflava TaxID=28449 RepID=UPI00202A268C|nr:hypothetical protein [Neisseria subflava]MCL9786720.1 hypothetical protein [Neisseria subflava]
MRIQVFAKGIGRSIFEPSDLNRATAPSTCPAASRNTEVNTGSARSPWRNEWRKFIVFSA